MPGLVSLARTMAQPLFLVQANAMPGQHPSGEITKNGHGVTQDPEILALGM